MVENNKFYQEGNRIFTSMGEEKCPLGCIYCFVDSDGYQKLGRLDTDIGNQELKYEVEEADGLKTIVPAHDVELFLIRDWFPQLMKLSEYGLDIIVATKAVLTKRQIDQLIVIDENLKSKNALIQVAVSLPRLDQEGLREIELFTPSPERRIETAKKLYESGISTNIAIRPTLPYVPEEEYRELIDNTYQFCDSYLTSPLYLTPAMVQYMNKKHPEYEVEEFSPSFMQGRPSIQTINTDNTSAMIGKIAAEYGKSCFDSATPSIQLAHSLRGR